MTDTRYEQFLRAVTEFGTEVVANAEAIRGWGQYIDDEARDTAHVAGMIAAKRVDKDTVSETHELAQIMRGVSEQSIQYAATSDTTARLAKASHDEAVNSHQGISEQVNASPAVGIHDVDNDWLAQE
jgi:hypothetical protein